MRTNKVLIITGGVLSVLFTIFHLMFYKLFHWETNLQCLTHSDRAIMLTFNAIGILFLFYASIMSFIFRHRLAATGAGKSILLFFASFFVLRIITEFVCFGYRGIPSMIIILVCLIPVVCYTIPVFRSNK